MLHRHAIPVVANLPRRVSLWWSNNPFEMFNFLLWFVHCQFRSNLLLLVGREALWLRDGYFSRFLLEKKEGQILRFLGNVQEQAGIVSSSGLRLDCAAYQPTFVCRSSMSRRKGRS